MFTPTRHGIALYSNCIFILNFLLNTPQWRHYLREQRKTNISDYFENSAVLYVILEIDKFITCVNEA